MYNVIVIDDDLQLANNLSKTINQKIDSFSVISCFSNGNDAVDFLLDNNNEVDLVISDIEMPYIDGFQLAQKVKNRYPNIDIILMMGYSAYEYAKKAIDLDVEALIKKPIATEELMVVLNKLKIKLDKKKKEKIYVENLKEYQENSLPVVKDSILYSLVKNSNKELFEEDKLKYLDLNFDYQNYLIVSLELSERIIRNNTRIDDILLAIRLIAKREIESISDFESFRVYEKLFFIIKFNQYDNVFVSNLDGAFNNIVLQINQQFNIPCSIGISSVFSDLNLINNAYEQAKQAVGYSLFMGLNKIYYYDNHIDSDDQTISMHDLQELGHNITYNNLDKIYDSLNVLKAKIKELKNINDYYFMLTEILNIILNKSENIQEIYKVFGDEDNFYLKLIVNKNLDNVFEKFKNICKFIKSDNEKVLSNNVQNNAKIAIDYIEHNYTDSSLTLESVAKYVNLSVSYICYLLKKEHNTTFVKYLTKLRINEAKSLLKNTNMKIIDVAEKVGYSDAYYFSHNFKKITGFSPKEYRIKK